MRKSEDYRKRAERARQLASAAQPKKIVDMFHRIAANYDALAKQAARLERKLSQKPKA